MSFYICNTDNELKNSNSNAMDQKIGLPPTQSLPKYTHTHKIFFFPNKRGSQNLQTTQFDTI